jgi:hypothetical protein
MAGPPNKKPAKRAGVTSFGRDGKKTPARAGAELSR